VTGISHRRRSTRLLGLVFIGRQSRPWDTTSLPNKTLQQTAATGIALPGLEVAEVAAAAELRRSAGWRLLSLATVSLLWEHGAVCEWCVEFSIAVQLV
jgi:hypothetical protein